LASWRLGLACAGLALPAALALGWVGAWTPWTAGEITGVDVSHHQGPIDWSALAADDVRFAYIKATEGGDFVDPRFRANWEGSAAAGIRPGAYHFFTLCRPGVDQARNFIASVPVLADALPPALDLEHMGPCTTQPQLEDPASEIRAFLDATESHFGVRPILYTTAEFHDAYLRSFEGERFWIRSLFRRPTFREREWVLWQHHHRAWRDGVSGVVDLDVFRGDEAAFRAFTIAGALATR